MKYTEKITLANTLKSLGETVFRNIGSLSETGTVEWTGLDLKHLEMSATSLYKANGIEKIENVEKYQVKPTATPTPLPPTPTPTPDPANPKLKHTQQMGEDVVYEFWDNDILYIKGTGATWKVSYYTIDYTWAKKVVIEEGITHLRECSLFIDFEEIVFPKSLVETDLGVGFVYPDNVVTAYKNGEKVTITVTEKTDIGRFLEANFGIKTEVIE